MSCTSIPPADSPCRSVTAGAPSIVSVAVRFSGAVTYPIERRRTAGSGCDPADDPGVAGAAAPSSDGAATAGGGAAVGAASTAGWAATEGELDGLQRSTRARGGAPSPGIFGTVADRLAGSGAGAGC